MGVSGSVSHMYENLCVVRFKGLSEETVIDSLISNDIDIDDIELNNDTITIYGKPQDFSELKR